MHVSICHKMFQQKKIERRKIGYAINVRIKYILFHKIFLLATTLLGKTKALKARERIEKI